MTASRCPRCDAEIPAGAPEGLCPRCLLQSSQTGPYTPSTGFQPPAVEALKGAFPQWEILELLGQGGMGAVYKARQASLDRLVAVKILPPEYSRDPSFVERFLREAKALARLNHPNIVGVYDVGQAGGFCFFAMEYVDGVNLRQALRAGQMQPAEALKIVPQLCDALQYAHDEGIVHRDIKPENILLDRKGRVKIADFGLAKLLGQSAPDLSLTGTRQVMGTLRYMAPEQLEGAKNVDHRADIYSMGVTFYEMLTGEVPMGRFAPPSKKVAVDVRIDEVVLRTLEREPKLRFQQASDVKTEVEAITRSPQPTVSVAAPPSGPAASALLRKPADGYMIWAIVAAVAWLGATVWQSGQFHSQLDPRRQLMDFLNIMLPGLTIICGLNAYLLRHQRGWLLTLMLTILTLVPAAFGFESWHSIKFVFWLGVPLAPWTVYLLFRDDVRAGYDRPANVGRWLKRTAHALDLWFVICALTGLGAYLWKFFPAFSNGGAALLGLALASVLAGYLLRQTRGRRLILTLAFAMLLPAIVVTIHFLDVGWQSWSRLYIFFWLSVPLAIWIIVLLYRDDVRAEFDKPRPPEPPIRWLRAAMAGLALALTGLCLAPWVRMESLESRGFSPTLSHLSPVDETSGIFAIVFLLAIAALNAYRICRRDLWSPVFTSCLAIATTGALYIFAETAAHLTDSIPNVRVIHEEKSMIIVVGVGLPLLILALALMELLLLAWRRWRGKDSHPVAGSG